MKERQRHIIHKAVQWKRMLDNGEVESLSEIARHEGLSRPRVTQIMNLLKLPADYREFLAGLSDPKVIRKFPEKKLRNCLSDGSIHKLPPIDGKPERPLAKRKPRKRQSVNWEKNPPEIIVQDAGEMPPENLEVLKILIKKAAIRKLREFEVEAKKKNTTVRALLEKELRKRARRKKREQMLAALEKP